jgi:hypothetical protein
MVLLVCITVWKRIMLNNMLHLSCFNSNAVYSLELKVTQDSLTEGK